jgi:hypothetical protein
MSGWIVALVFLAPLLAFGMWLTFNAVLAKWYGLEALRVTPSIYRAFRSGDWNDAPKTGDDDAAA